MDRVAEIVYNDTTAVVETYPPDAVADGIPTTATCSVFDGERSLDDTADFSPTVTIDSVSTTVDVASGVSQTNRKRLYIAATTGIAIGRMYLLQNTAGERELVKVASIASADYVDLEHDLRFDYAITTSTLKGLRMTFPVNGTWVATESNILAPYVPPYKAVWSYTQNGVTRKHYTYLRLVRQRSEHNVTIYDIARRWGDAPDVEFRQERGKQAANAIEGAWQRFRADLLTAGYRPDQLRDSELRDRAVTLGAIAEMAKGGRVPGNLDPQWFWMESEKDYVSFRERLLARLRMDIDISTEGDVTRAPVQQLFFDR